MSVSLSTNRLELTIYVVRITVSRPKRLQTVARFEKKYRMTPLVDLTISFLEVTDTIINKSVVLPIRVSHGELMDRKWNWILFQ